MQWNRQNRFDTWGKLARKELTRFEICTQTPGAVILRSHFQTGLICCFGYGFQSVQTLSTLVSLPIPVFTILTRVKVSKSWGRKRTVEGGVP